MKKCLAFLLLPGFVLTAKAQHNYHEITLPALMKKYQPGASNMVIVDVRTKGEYHDTASMYKAGDIGRIKGTINIEVQDLETKPESLKALEQYKDKEVYLICSHSYRSRRASNILLQNGFTHVTNVQGGMTEWYRRYEELAPYRGVYETAVPYKNISSAELYEQLAGNKDLLLIGINLAPKTFFDSATQKFLQYVPAFKKAIYFNTTDSAQLLELVKKNPGKPVILFNNYSSGGAEFADWLGHQGISNIQYLVGGVSYFAEYLANKNMITKGASLLSKNNTINFITPVYFCTQLAGKTGTTIVDLRHDTLFNKVNSGIKSDYTHFKNSSSFHFAKGIEEFEKAYPDKKTQYVMISRNGVEGLELSEQLSKKGYKINWLLGGIGRFDWYTINVETLGCSDYLLRP